MKINKTFLDTKGVAIEPESVVKIHGNNRFTGYEGTVVATNSNKNPADGPIAVYFNREVPEYEFFLEAGTQDWGMPSAATHLTCPRAICFMPDELEVIPEISIENLVKRQFGEKYHPLYVPKFPLVPNSHACQMDECEYLATRKAIINVHGVLYVVYTCSTCYLKWNGCLTDDFKTKVPLPGSPVS